MTESAVFYKSLFDALADFPPENYKTAMQAIATYAFTGEEPEGLPLLENTAFLLVKPQIDKNAERYKKSLNGGRSQVELPSLKELEDMHSKIGGWDAVADKLGANKATLFRHLKRLRQDGEEVAIVATESQGELHSRKTVAVAKPNDNVNDNVSDTESVTVSVDETETVTKERVGQCPPVELQATPALLGSENLSQNSVLFPTEQVADSPQHAEQPQEKQKQKKKCCLCSSIGR